MEMKSFIQSLYKNNDNFRASILVIVLFCFLYLLFLNILPVLIPFILAFILSIVLNPLVSKLQKIGIPRAVGSGLLVLLFVALLITGLFVLSFFIHKYIVNYSENINDTVNFVANWIPKKLNDIAQRLHITTDINSEKIRSQLVSSLGRLTEISIRYAMSIVDHAKSIVSILYTTFIMTILSFYILKDWYKISEKVKQYIPDKFIDFINFALPNVQSSLRLQIIGQLKVCAISAAIYIPGLWAIGINPYFLIGITSGLLTFIPFLGIFIAFAFAFAYGLAQGIGLLQSILIILLYFTGSTIESNFLTPKFIGEKVGLHPIWLFFAVLSTLALFGIKGALFVLPLATIICSLIKSSAIWFKKA